MSTVSRVLASPRHLRRLRRQLDQGVSMCGILLILGAVLLVHDLRPQLLITTCGMVLIEVGVWRLAQRLLPSERQYHALRAEVDRFLHLVRGLNTAALTLKGHDTPEAHQAFAVIYQAMQDSVGRMAIVAGKTDAELVAAPVAPPVEKTI